MVVAGVARMASLKVLASMDTEESRAVMEEGLMVMVYRAVMEEGLMVMVYR